jgi:predicted nucleotidyltransferase
VSLLADVAAYLRSRGLPFAVIGATALAARGVSRATRDLDLLVRERGCLEAAFWVPLRSAGVNVDVRRGDAEDPLAGVVRITATDAPALDVVVGRSAWQDGVLDRATPVDVEGTSVPVATASDLVLLKLLAGGPQDAWDVGALLAGGSRESIVRDVDALVGQLPRDARDLWQRLRSE